MCHVSLGCLGSREGSPTNGFSIAGHMINNCPVGGALCTGSAVRQCVAILNKLDSGQTQRALHRYLCPSLWTQGKIKRILWRNNECDQCSMIQLVCIQSEQSPRLCKIWKEVT